MSQHFVVFFFFIRAFKIYETPLLKKGTSVEKEAKSMLRKKCSKMYENLHYVVKLLDNTIK